MSDRDQGRARDAYRRMNEARDAWCAAVASAFPVGSRVRWHNGWETAFGSGSVVRHEGGMVVVDSDDAGVVKVPARVLLGMHAEDAGVRGTRRAAR